MPQLTPRQRWARFGIIGVSALLFALPILKSLNPSLPAPPCGFKALTGLPCLLCGGTRSACAALHGDFAYSLYLNPLSLPVLFALLLIALTSAAEILRGCAFADWQASSRSLLKFSPPLLLLLFAWWTLHIITALLMPKPELMDPDKPIASKLRSWINQ
jgi:hypothetical protein